MLSSNVHCVVVEVLEPGDTMDQDHYGAHDLLPWADPYIAQLLGGPRFRSAAVTASSSTTRRHRGRPWDGCFSNELSPPWEEFRLPGQDSLRRGQCRSGLE